MSKKCREVSKATAKGAKGSGGALRARRKVVRERIIMKKFAFATATLFLLFSGTSDFGAADAMEPVEAVQNISYVVTAPAETVQSLNYVVAPVKTVPARVTVLIDGGTAPSAFYGEMVSGTTYAPVREFAIAMGANSVIRAGNTASVSASGLELRATAGDIFIEANGRYLYVPERCLLISDSVYAPVRILAKAFGATVDWNGEFLIARVTPGAAPISKELPYSDEDLYWMSRIITAEARGESFEGQIAVGNVIMNRIASDIFPDTVYDVVFDGIQFTPAVTGAIYNTPTEQCTLAAKLALEGVRTVGDSLFFSATTNCWANGNREYSGAIGGHYFYA